MDRASAAINSFILRTTDILDGYQEKRDTHSVAILEMRRKLHFTHFLSDFVQNCLLLLKVVSLALFSKLSQTECLEKVATFLH